jgi:cyclic pyranopterin phosphate synthase
MTLTHIDQQGSASMVDVSGKEVTSREASAFSRIRMSRNTLDLVKNNMLKKGDVIATARIAGIQAAKQCSNLIPLCHPLMLNKVAVDFEFNDILSSIDITSYCKLSGLTGVEMEALTAASVSALTIYDMCKAAELTMEISDVYLLEKSGGRRGHYQRLGGDSD